jgi:CRP-like cAMP-binding protein
MEKNNSHYHQLKDHIQKSILIGEEGFDYVFRHFAITHFKKKEYLLMPHQVCRNESFITEGLFQTSIVDDSGKKHVLYFPHEDWWVGDFKSFKTGEGSSMEIQALEDATVLQITRPGLEEVYRKLPVFERFFRILNENAGIALQDRIVQNYSQNAEKKYAEFRKKYPELRNRLSQKRIAGYLGITPEYFSQIHKK